MTAVGKGEADVLVGNTTVTSARIKTVEFSQPYFRSGLQIMIPEARPHTFARLWENIVDFGHLTVFWYILGIVLLVTILVTLFERKHNPDFPKTWSAGFAEAFYYVISLTLTNKSAYKGFAGVLGRLMLVFWMVLGFLMVTYVTAAVTAAMTVEQLRTRINGPPGSLWQTCRSDHGQCGSRLSEESRDHLQGLPQSGGSRRRAHSRVGITKDRLHRGRRTCPASLRFQ